MSPRTTRITRGLVVASLIGGAVWFYSRDTVELSGSFPSRVTGPSQRYSLLAEPSPSSPEMVAPSKTGRAKLALTGEEIEALGLQFREGVSEEIRRQAFKKLIAGLTPENAMKVRKQIAHVPRHSDAFSEFHRAWGRVAEKSAVLEAGKLSRQATAETLAGWASQSPEEAKRFFQNLQSSAHNGDGTTNHFSKEYLRLGLVKGLAEDGTNIATAFVQEQFESKEVGDKKAGDMIRIVADSVGDQLGMEEASKWAESLPDSLRNEALAGIVKEHASVDVKGALDWLESYEDPAVHKGAAYYHIFDSWMRQDSTAASEYIATMPDSYQRHEAISALAQWSMREDPTVALEWTETIDDLTARHRILSDSFNTWARNDPIAASEHLVTMPASADRDHAIHGFAGMLALDDPGAAVAWADQIADVPLRQAALTTVALSYFETDPAAASAWLPHSGLPNGTIERVLNPSVDDIHRTDFLTQK